MTERVPEEQESPTLPKVPDPFTVITGMQELINQRRDEFFNEVLDYLGYDTKARETFTSIEDRNAAYEGTPLRPTDDRITWLIAQHYVVASVLERRNDLNNVEVLFSLYLTRQRIDQLRLFTTNQQRLDTPRDY